MTVLVIVISAITCAGAAYVLYKDRSSAPAAGVAVVSFVVLLYGIGQYVESDKTAAQSPPPVDVAEQRTVKETPIPDAQKPKPDAVAASRPQRNSPEEAAKNLPPPSQPQFSAVGTAAASVTISNVTTERPVANYVEVSGTVVNGNDFAIKNLVVKCGDRTFAYGDVSTKIDKVVPARSVVNIARVRMGPIKPHLPPTACLVERFDRAD